MRGLKDKAAIVTGAAQGIGKAIAERLTEEGCRVLWADIDAQKVMQAQMRTGKGLAMKVDISKEAEVRQMVARAKEAFGRLDILINNAARFVFNHVTEVTEEGNCENTWHTDAHLQQAKSADKSAHQIFRIIATATESALWLRSASMCADWDRVLGTNVKGTAFAIKHAARAMIEAQTAGSIVNIASTSASVAQPAFVPYSASKGAILQITRCSALDLGKANIRVNALCPGPILTDASGAHAASVGKSLEDLCKEMTEPLILQRMGKVSEVAAAAAFLASEESSFITGTTLTIDGGLTAL